MEDLVGRTINVSWPPAYKYPMGLGWVMNKGEASSSQNNVLSSHTHLGDFNEMILQCKIYAWLPNSDKKFEFDVMSYDASLDMHMVTFDNGNAETLKLSPQEEQPAGPLLCPTPKDIVSHCTRNPNMKNKACDHLRQACERGISVPSIPENEEKTRTKQDVGWNHGKIICPSKCIQCNHCGKIIKGGSITRLKHHIAGGYTDVESCKKCPMTAINEIKEFLAFKKQKLVTDSSKSKVDKEQNGTVGINGYKVKATSAPILEAIFTKYGDIAKDCIFKSPSVRASLLEVVCDVVLNLQNYNSDTILVNHETIQKGISDVEAAKIDTSWLDQHVSKLNQVSGCHKENLLLKKSKENLGLVINEASEDLKRKNLDLHHAQKHLLRAQKRVKQAVEHLELMNIVGQKIDDEILTSEKDEDSWRRQLAGLLVPEELSE